MWEGRWLKFELEEVEPQDVQTNHMTMHHVSAHDRIALLIRLCANLSHLDSDSHIVNPGPQSRAPGSLLRDVDPITTAISKRRRSQLHLPLPSSEGCGRLLVEVGGPSSASRKWAMTNVVAYFLPFLLCQPTTNTQYTHSATTTTSLASKRELEVDFSDCLTHLPPVPSPSHPNASQRWIILVISRHLPPLPPPSHPNASRRWSFSAFQRTSHLFHLPRI